VTTQQRYCRCARWRRFTHVESEHATFESRAEYLTPRRWKREQRSIPIAVAWDAEQQAYRVAA
jgi:hypothetical protein